AGGPPSIGLLELRVALGLSWDETRAAICSLRSILNEKPRRMDKLLDVIHALCSELSGDTSLARGFLRLIQKFGAYDLPARLLHRFARCPVGAWGSHVRSSPHSSTELLHDLDEFVPPWNVFSKEDMIDPSAEFYDVVQWLKVCATTLTSVRHPLTSPLRNL
ncbi:hypothetical protein B0H13DRAFT_2101258, partial [Mycena leptocephala]